MHGILLDDNLKAKRKPEIKEPDSSFRKGKEVQDQIYNKISHGKDII